MTDREPYDAPMLTKHAPLLDITGATKTELDNEEIAKSEKTITDALASSDAKNQSDADIVKNVTDSTPAKTTKETAEKMRDKDTAAG